MDVSENTLPATLEALKAASPGIRGVFLSNSQGGILGSSQLSGMEKVQLAAVSAASLAIASKASADLHLGMLNRVHVIAESGSLLLIRVGSKAVLSVLIAEDATVELVTKEANRTAATLSHFV